MGLARAIPAQRNTRGHWTIHPATSGGDASIPSSPGGSRRREDAALGDPHQAPAHLSCFGWAEDFRNRVCQYCYGLFDQLRDGAIGHGPQCGSQRCSAGCRHRAVHHSPCSVGYQTVTAASQCSLRAASFRLHLPFRCFGSFKPTILLLSQSRSP